MTKYLTEILEEIDKDPSAIEKYKTNAALKYIMQYSFNPKMKFLLPEGDPPFKPDPAPLGMSPGNLLMETKKLYIFTAERQDLSQVRRESLFIQLLENVHPSEAKLLLAIKDQNLPKLYKNVTKDLAVKAGFVEPGQVEEKKKRGRPPKQKG
jgi:hypothetical protein